VGLRTGRAGREPVSGAASSKAPGPAHLAPRGPVGGVSPPCQAYPIELDTRTGPCPLFHWLSAGAGGCRRRSGPLTRRSTTRGARWGPLPLVARLRSVVEAPQDRGPRTRGPEPRRRWRRAPCCRGPLVLTSFQDGRYPADGSPAPAHDVANAAGVSSTAGTGALTHGPVPAEPDRLSNGGGRTRPSPAPLVGHHPTRATRRPGGKARSASSRWRSSSACSGQAASLVAARRTVPAVHRASRHLRRSIAWSPFRPQRNPQFVGLDLHRPAPPPC
jgi:hypothetical protein